MSTPDARRLHGYDISHVGVSLHQKQLLYSELPAEQEEGSGLSLTLWAPMRQ